MGSRGSRSAADCDSRAFPVMISLPTGVRIWLVAGVTDMRRGIDGLCALIQSALSADPFGGQLFIFRGRRGNHVSLCILSVEAGKFECSILSILCEVIRSARG